MSLTKLNLPPPKMFSSLASFILSNGGTVYGVSMSDDCYSAEFVRITDNKDLAKLRGSASGLQTGADGLF